MGLTLPKEYLSASQIGCYQRCGMQYWFRYIEGIKSPPAIAAMQGSSVHAGNEAYYKEKAIGNSPMTPKQVAQYSAEWLLETAKEEELRLSDTEEKTAVKEVQIAAETYISTVGERVVPIRDCIEKEIWYTARCGVTVLGYIDLMRQPTDAEYFMDFELYERSGEYPDADMLGGLAPVICDYKITSKKWSVNNLKNSLQFHLYTIATGFPRVEIHNITKTTKKPSLLRPRPDKLLAEEHDVASNVRLVRHRFDGREYNHVENTIERVARAISAGIFIPCDLGHWACNEKWCGYWKMCRGSGTMPRAA